MMKEMVKQAKAAGQKFTCDGCHKDLDNYELTKNANEDFKKLEAVAEEVARRARPPAALSPMKTITEFSGIRPARGGADPPCPSSATLRLPAEACDAERSRAAPPKARRPPRPKRQREAAPAEGEAEAAPAKRPRRRPPEGDGSGGRRNGGSGGRRDRGSRGWRNRGGETAEAAAAKPRDERAAEGGRSARPRRKAKRRSRERLRKVRRETAAPAEGEAAPAEAPAAVDESRARRGCRDLRRSLASRAIGWSG